MTARVCIFARSSNYQDHHTLYIIIDCLTKRKKIVHIWREPNSMRIDIDDVLFLTGIWRQLFGDHIQWVFTLPDYYVRES